MTKYIQKVTLFIEIDDLEEAKENEKIIGILLNEKKKVFNSMYLALPEKEWSKL